MSFSQAWAFRLARIAAASLCFVAVSKQPYNFYVLTRWAVFAVCIWGFSLEQKRTTPFVAIAYVALGILFNPLIPFHFKRETWKPLDIIAGAVLLVSFAFSPPRRNNK